MMSVRKSQLAVTRGASDLRIFLRPLSARRGFANEYKYCKEEQTPLIFQTIYSEWIWFWLSFIDRTALVVYFWVFSPLSRPLPISPLSCTAVPSSISLAHSVNDSAAL